jgi:Sulfotransferase family
MPDFFIVGHHKSGTTALYRMLRPHPQIFLPSLKEPSFFLSELGPQGGRRPSAHLPHTLEAYLQLFAPAAPEQRAGEASASYLWSPSAAERIAKAAPEARIIAILREPASFLRSLHLQFLRNHAETEKDLRKALALESLRREGKALPRHSTRPRALLYSEQVKYVEQLRRYRDVFPAERVLILIYDDYRADNEGSVRRVLRFLDVDDTVPIEVAEANPAARVRSPRLQALVRSLYMGKEPGPRIAKTGIKAITPRRLRHEALAVQQRLQRAKPQPPDEELVRELRRRFKGEVVALSEYLDRDLVTLWGYDRLD